MAKGASKISGGGHVEARQFESINDARGFFEDKWMRSLPWQESMAIYNYTDTGYRAINSHLRFDDSADAQTLADINYIDSAIAKSVLTRPIVVSRGCSGAMFGLPDDRKPTIAELNQFVGRTFTDKGFVSTSAGGKTFMDFVSLQITVPAGKGRGGYVGGHSAHPIESEFLIRRNGRYKVTGVASDGTVSIQML